jgi:YHS domain-containing protein
MIANTTGGTYYFAATSDELKSIYEAIGMTLAFAGTDINVTETAPSFLTYDNDASKQPSVTTSGGATILSWHVGTLKVGEEWQVTYTAKAQKGVEAVSTVSQCKVEYKTSASASALLNLTPGIVFHDIAVTTLKAVPGSTSKGGIIALQIGAKNNGPSRETFDLRTTYDGSILDSRIVVLEIGQSTLITINWNTSNVDPGKYKLTTEADPEQKLWDANRSDNSATTNVEILGPSGVSIFLIFMIILITTVAGAGVAYGSSRLIHSTYRKPRKLRSPYLCTVDGSPLKSTYMGKVWYCPACGKNYEFD